MFSVRTCSPFSILVQLGFDHEHLPSGSFQRELTINYIFFSTDGMPYSFLHIAALRNDTPRAKVMCGAGC